jgi:hypothetical protein
MKNSVAGISMFVTPLWVYSSKVTAFLDMPLREMLYSDFTTPIPKKLCYFDLNWINKIFKIFLYCCYLYYWEITLYIFILFYYNLGSASNISILLKLIAFHQFNFSIFLSFISCDFKL